ncbi:hypothetical protein B0H19DRAFT_1243809 [Mycena capillaripes]|nr:hypothetical protein B0H19DRAFT_1243809 [Mycena capillaripes]
MTCAPPKMSHRMPLGQPPDDVALQNGGGATCNRMPREPPGGYRWLTAKSLFTWLIPLVINEITLKFTEIELKLHSSSLDIQKIRRLNTLNMGGVTLKGSAQKDAYLSLLIILRIIWLAMQKNTDLHQVGNSFNLMGLEVDIAGEGEFRDGGVIEAGPPCLYGGDHCGWISFS